MWHRRNIQIELYQLERNGQTHSSSARTRVFETEAEMQIAQSQNFELTTRICESTINELKTLGRKFASVRTINQV